MLLRIVFAITLAATTGSAAPTATQPYSWSPQLASFYNAVSKEIANVKKTTGYKNDAYSCDLTKAQANFPSAPTPLARAEDGSVLKHVVLGFGHQNYTCPDQAVKVANATAAAAAPSAVGAFAQLFNVSCIAANYPDILATLPGLAFEYQLPATYFPPEGTMGQNAAETPKADFSYQPLNVVYSGLHTFADLTTPRFNLDLADSGSKNGLILAKKSAATPAWSNSTAGANGAVPYLRLDTVAGTTNGYTHVYRMQTAGGMQPADCTANAGVFTMPYAATYWIYGK